MHIKHAGAIFSDHFKVCISPVWFESSAKSGPGGFLTMSSFVISAVFFIQAISTR